MKLIGSAYHREFNRLSKVLVEAETFEDERLLALFAKCIGEGGKIRFVTGKLESEYTIKKGEYRAEED